SSTWREDHVEQRRHSLRARTVPRFRHSQGRGAEVHFTGRRRAQTCHRAGDPNVHRVSMSAWSLAEGDCLQTLRQMPDNCVDAVVTDPPYGLSKDPDMVEVLQHWLAGDDYQHRGGGFMGKAWDSFVPGPSVWREVIRVLKPGGHALTFAGSR